MVRDLNFPVKVVVAPTVREPDGLAMSSRNKHLKPEQRRQATILWACLQEARRLVRARPNGQPAARLRQQLAKLVSARPGARLDYVEFFDPNTLEPVGRAKRGAHLALAVFVGPTRLIDNARL
jgi:pantoate--beta-alanine ligase